MKVNIFAVADSVAVYEQGKLVIVGTFDNIQAEKCPFAFRPFGVALKLDAERGDYGKSYKARLVLRKIRTTKSLVELQLPLNFPKPSQGKRISGIFAANLGGIIFDSFGQYVFELRVGSKVVSSINLNVIKSKSTKKVKSSKTKATGGKNK